MDASEKWGHYPSVHEWMAALKWRSFIRNVRGVGRCGVRKKGGSDSRNNGLSRPVFGGGATARIQTQIEKADI